MPLSHFTRISDVGVTGLAELVNQALELKRQGFGQRFVGKILGQVYFNPSLRTRASFEAAMMREGGGSVVLEVGSGTWKLEHEDGVVMDADRAEHIKEAAPVLSRYVDALAVRTFSRGISDEDDEEDAVLRSFRRYATVPVISLESAREHPCQGVADMLTLKERFGDLKGQPVTLCWAPHIKPLPKAVPNSFLLHSCAMGCDVRVAHPEGFDLAPQVLDEARQYASEAGGSLTVTQDRQAALRESLVVYPKAWRPNSETQDLQRPEWMCTLADFGFMDPRAVLMHCLPTRRNLEIHESVLDSPRSAVIDEAENRLHAQRAILQEIFQP